MSATYACATTVPRAASALRRADIQIGETYVTTISGRDVRVVVTGASTIRAWSYTVRRLDGGPRIQARRPEELRRI